MAGPFSVDNIRVELDPAVTQKIAEWRRSHPDKAGRGRRVKTRGRYLSGRIPMAWLTAADAAGALMVAVGLRYLYGLHHSLHPDEPAFVASTKLLKPWRIDASRKRRGLLALAAASLIKVEWRGRVNPLVIIIELGE